MSYSRGYPTIVQPREVSAIVGHKDEAVCRRVFKVMEIGGSPHRYAQRKHDSRFIADEASSKHTVARILIEIQSWPSHARTGGR